MTGAGQMAGSMVKGWLSKGVLKPTQVDMIIGVNDIAIIILNGINATIVLKHQLKLWQVLASVPVQDSALLEPLTSLACAGDVIFVIDTSSLVVLVMSYFNLTSTNIVSVHNHASWQFDFQEQTTTWRLQIGRRWENINAAH